MIKIAKLYFRYGAMNCGKSTSIIQVAYNYEERDKKILLMKPSKDTKGDKYVINRSGLKRKTDFLLKPDDDILKIVPNNIDAVLIDEAQFLTEEQVDQLYYLTKINEIPVICYGLRCDFQMNLFPGSMRLLAIADSIEELKTICRCGKKATQNIRLINNKPVFTGEQVAIDGKDLITYESVCGKCFLEIKNKEVIK